MVYVPNIREDHEYRLEALATAAGYLSVLAVPTLREGKPIGVITVTGAEAGAFSRSQIALLETFADQAVIAIENARLFKELDARNRDLSEALEQQTATSGILGVISRSPMDVEPVFAAVVSSAARLCEAHDVAMLLVAGDDVRPVAGVGPLYMSLPSDLRIRLTRDSAATRAVVDRTTVHIHDFAAESEEEYPVGRELARRFGHRSMLAVPLLREGVPIGVICAFRLEVRPFPDQQIALLRTFADQAVIAIENVRLFTETKEALEQRTATSEVLQVISASPTDLRPVFETILRSAMQLCAGFYSLLFLCNGEQLDLAATHNVPPEGLEALRRRYPLSITSDDAGLTARAVRERRLQHVVDIQSEPTAPAAVRRASQAVGQRAAVAVPLLREGEPVGVLTVSRQEARAFSEKELTLLQTFAAQAVVAIENVRLFKELQARNHDLTEALEQQTATAEILRVISQSQTDVRPVFDTIVRSAVRLCDGLFSGLIQFDGELLHHVAHHNFTPEALEEVRRLFPARPSRGLGSGRAILERAVVHVPDVELDPEWQHLALPHAIGFRSGLFVPMLREGAPIGAIAVTRAEPGPFSDNEIELLKTFADQAVIAVENVRLFKELEARTGELTQSVEKLTALGEVSQALSSTLDVETVLNTIVSRASQLAGAAGCSIYEYDEAAEQFELRATYHYDAEFVEALRAVPLRKREGLMGRAAEMREPVQIPDIAQPGAYRAASGTRSSASGTGRSSPCPCSARTRSSAACPSTEGRQASFRRRSWTF
jgi:two-component system, NtrC family, sensor kinase